MSETTGDILPPFTFEVGELFTAAKINNYLLKSKVKPESIKAYHFSADALDAIAKTAMRAFYKVGDIVITRDDENPTKRFGGTWEKLENKTIIGASEEHAAGTDGVVELKCGATVSAMLFGDNGDYATVYSNGWCRQGGQRGGSGRHSWYIPFKGIPYAYGATAMGYGQQSTVGIAAELETFLIAWVDNGNGHWRSPAFKWWAEGFIDMAKIETKEEVKASMPVSYEYIWRKVSDEDEE